MPEIVSPPGQTGPQDQNFGLKASAWHRQNAFRN